MTDFDRLARRAYEAYGEYLYGSRYQPWERLPEGMRQAWRASVVQTDMLLKGAGVWREPGVGD